MDDGDLAAATNGRVDPLALGLVGGSGIVGSLRYERPAYIYDHVLKDCTAGAFAFFNSNGQTSAYRCHFGRYSQIGELAVLGPPEHPMDWFSSHPFAFTRPRFMPKLYQLEEFARLAPDEQAGPSYVETVPSETWIGHEAYVGAGSFIRRGVRIGNGAVIGARSVVTRDVPDYAVVAGTPAKVLRLRYADNLVERFIKLQWWKYDLAPFKHHVDYRSADATLAFFEEKLADGQLQALTPTAYKLTKAADGLRSEPLSAPLYFHPGSN